MPLIDYSDLNYNQMHQITPGFCIIAAAYRLLYLRFIHKSRLFAFFLVVLLDKIQNTD